jgi:hypothetical protein
VLLIVITVAVAIASGVAVASGVVVALKTQNRWCW